MRSPPQDVAQEVTACRVAARYLTSTSSSASRFEPSIVTAAHRLIYMCLGQEFNMLRLQLGDPGVQIRHAQSDVIVKLASRRRQRLSSC